MILAVSSVRMLAHSMLGGIAAATLILTATPGQASFVRNREAGFVVADIKYALSPEDARKAGACPNGMSLGPREIYALTPAGKRRRAESDMDYEKRLQQGARQVLTAENGENLCMNPRAGGPDPHFRTITGSAIPVDGIDLDGRVSPEDFNGLDGKPGVDNQFFRAVGCSQSFQPTGLSNQFKTEMLTGSWGILIKLSDVDDIRNDENVKVGIYANADPIQLSPDRTPLGYATYAMEQNPRFRAETRGRIRNGILTTEPVDVRFYHVVNSIILERSLRAARLRATLSRDGILDGHLAGYTPVEAMYDLQYGFRNGKDKAGGPAPLKLRMHSASGAASVLGHTCHGAYHALQQHADGHPDTKTGKFTSISTQYRIKAIPAFVVDVETRSLNELAVSKSGTGKAVSGKTGGPHGN